MAPPRQGDRKKAPSKPSKPKAPRTRQPTKQLPDSKATNDTDSSPIDLSTTIPLPLQQLLLDVFKTALLLPPPTTQPPTSPDQGRAEQPNPDPGPESESTPLDTKALIQTIKSHLYQRDFDSAFTDADEALLRVYALRWSAARALGYAGIFKAVLGWMSAEREREMMDEEGESACGSSGDSTNVRVVCIGGGAGAEIVALAASWRDLGGGDTLDARVAAGVSLNGEVDGKEGDADECHPGAGSPGSMAAPSPRLDVAAVDIADWSSVVERLSRTIVSSAVPTPKTSRYQPPLVSDSNVEGSSVSICFHRSDVLNISESGLKDILLGIKNTPSPSPSPSSSSPSSSLLVTLMFTLNELFSTSMAKATTLLLRMTDILPPGAVLLVVDSPGSYSTLKLGKGKDAAARERQYPMKFLLDHTLLSVAEGKWERVLTQDSRWWRRDAARLRYDVGEGAGLEDMRFQVHLYRRLP